MRKLWLYVVLPVLIVPSFIVAGIGERAPFVLIGYFLALSQVKLMEEQWQKH